MAVQERRRLPLTERSAAPHVCSRPVRLEVLKRVPLFAALSTAEIVEMEPQLQAHGYQAGEIIYRYAENADSLFVLASGTAKLVRPSMHGVDVVTNILGPGEGFGTLGVLGEPSYADSAEAMTTSCALEIPAGIFKDVMARHPRLTLTVLDEVLHRFERAQQNIRRLSVDNVDQRVAASLVALSDKFGDPRSETVTLDFPLTRTDLAALTGTTPETASRVMSRLRKNGIVDTGRRWTVILDRPRLAIIAEG